MSSAQAAPQIQIFGTKKSSATRAAERFFKERGVKVIGVNPVRTGYGAIADEWIGIRPGTEPQRQSGIAERASDRDDVSLPRAVTSQTAARRQRTHDGDTDTAGAPGGITARQTDPVLRRQRVKTARKRAHPGPITIRQRQRQQHRHRARAHRGKIRQVDRQRFPADVFGRIGHCEVHALDQGVDAPAPVFTATGRENGGIVPHSQQHFRPGSRHRRENAVDDRELAHGVNSREFPQPAARGPACRAPR